MRAISIAQTVKNVSVIFMGSNLHPYLHLMPDHLRCVHLPADIPAADEQVWSASDLSFLHYAPLGLAGQRERTAIMTRVFNQPGPLVLIVDVSVEVTLLARLCGIPTVVIRQHGDRNDLAHLQAYESAELLIAPFPKTMEPPFALPWLNDKTLYAGGFSKYSSVSIDNLQEEQPNQIGILLGEGGTSIDQLLIKRIVTCCPDYHFHVIGIGNPAGEGEHPGLTWHGKLADPAQILRSCAVVIGNAGHNTVMEMADLNKRFVCIPEERPFNEQRQKAELLAITSTALVIYPEELNSVDWSAALQGLQATVPQWNDVTDPAALQHIATAIEQLFKSF